MCLAAIASGLNPRFPWALASNRDEFFDRAAAPLHWWSPLPGDEPILAGRDLSAGGTWLGLRRNGRLALVTNVREPGRHLTVAPSRGDLVPLWLRSAAVQAQPGLLLQPARNGFNLLASDLAGRSLGTTSNLWLSNRADAPQMWGDGVHGLSNAALNTAWPKVTRLTQQLGQILKTAQDRSALTQAAFAALADRSLAPDEALPSTGVPLERERALSALFIRITAPGSPHAVYGTRCSTVVVAEQHGARRWVHVTERTMDSLGQVSGEVFESFEVTP
jgi:uncharacterized protein with NRDE domain